MFVRGVLPPGRKRKGSVEMYDSGRFFTVTGHRLPRSPASVMDRSEQLAALHRRVFGEPVTPRAGGFVGKGNGHGGAAHDIGDVELIERATRATNGDKFGRLWAGDVSDYATGDNEGRSEADLALCSLLAFWTGPDEERIDGLFRRSGLMRPKWDERHYGDGWTYGQGTVGKALDGKGDFWSGGRSIPKRAKVYARRKRVVSLG